MSEPLDDDTMLQILIKSYGPQVLPLAMFVVIWFTAVQPILNSRDESQIEQRELLKQMATVSATMERTAHTLERIAMMRGASE